MQHHGHFHEKLHVLEEFTALYSACMSVCQLTMVVVGVLLFKCTV